MCLKKASWCRYGAEYVLCKAKKVLGWLSDTPGLDPDASGRGKLSPHCAPLLWGGFVVWK